MDYYFLSVVTAFAVAAAIIMQQQQQQRLELQYHYQYHHHRFLHPHFRLPRHQEHPEYGHYQQ